MKKHIAINLKLSAGALFFIFILDMFVKNNSFTYHYFTVLYFSSIYMAQAIFLSILSNSPTRLPTIYAAATLLKMFVSLIFLALYYLFLSEPGEPRQKINFALFFIITYFTYLAVNTRSFFINTNEKQK